jgi:outer membrane beta-barrel protein
LIQPPTVSAQESDAQDDTSVETELLQEGKSGAAQKVDLERIRTKYWTKGDATEFRVVQNRYYKKSGKFELGAYAGSALFGSSSSDPFITIRQAGGSFGYHLNEYFSVGFLYWKYFVSPSSAYNDFKSQTTTVQVNSNEPNSFMGGELVFSPIYGKLSLMGKMILYYDLHLLGGVGRQDTFSGAYTAPFVGLGQQIFIKKWLSIRLDYRGLFYTETVLERFGTPEFPVGSKRGERKNQSAVVLVGLTFLLGGAE